MAFVYLGGDGSTKPTYFEVYAAEKLVPSLKAAIIYSLSVFGQRRSWVQRLLAYEEEVCLVVSLLLDRQSLRSMDGTFAETLYGLKREATRASSGSSSGGNSSSSSSSSKQAAAAALGSAGSPEEPRRLARRQVWLALACEALLPYLGAKLDQLHSKYAPRGVLGLAVARVVARRPFQANATAMQRAIARLQLGTLSAFLAVYPYASAGVQAAKFAYHLSYLLDVSPYHSPVMHAIGQRLVRLSGQELAALERTKQQRRQGQLAAARARSPWLLGLLQRGLLHANYIVNDNSRSVLILSVFAFKILEWWYTSAEERLTASQTLPPPPPPKAPLPDAHGVGLPQDATLCPLCRRQCVNPALLAVSGYVFCYPCLFNWVAEEGCCPVTRFPAGIDHIRKLYEAT